MFWNFNYLPSFARCLSEIPNRGSPHHIRVAGRGALVASAAQAFPFSRVLRSQLPVPSPLVLSLSLSTAALVPQPLASVAITSAVFFRNGFSVYGVRSQGMIQSFSVLLQALFVNNNLFAAFTRLKGTLSPCLFLPPIARPFFSFKFASF